MDLHDAFEDMRILKSLVWKMLLKKRKFKNLKRYKKNFQILKMLKLLKKENEVLKKKNEWLTSYLFIFSYGQKYFEMILIRAQLVYALLIGVQSTGVLWFRSSDGSNQQNL